jgi:hypothetical protein
MQTVTTIGLDIAKSVFQVHGIDAEDRVIIRRQLKCRYVLAFFEKLPPCLVGIEACASSHHWSRELKALGQMMGETTQKALHHGRGLRAIRSIGLSGSQSMRLHRFPFQLAADRPR